MLPVPYETMLFLFLFGCNPAYGDDCTEACELYAENCDARDDCDLVCPTPDDRDCAACYTCMANDDQCGAVLTTSPCVEACAGCP